MINDFDLLLNKCKTRMRKKIIYFTLRIFGSIALVILGIFGYNQWKISTQQPIVKPSPKVIEPVAIEENNSIIPVAVPSVVKKTVTPISPPVTILPKPLAATLTVQAQAPTVPTSPVATNRLLEVSSATSTPMSPEQTYQRSPKFETALVIARNFYAKEDYAQAAIWAKKANHMNREAEEAWLLYAKSYYAQGKKNEAIGVLELYLNYKESKAATDLIKAWK